MDDTTFDHLARRVETLVSRRATLSALAGASLIAALGGLRREAAAKGKKKKCKPKSKATTCRGKCGSVKNNCKKTVNCSACICTPSCPTCQRCNGGTGVCQPDPAQKGDACGSAGQICLDNGSCACDASSCGGGTVCREGTCQECGFFDAPCCSGNQCQAFAICGAAGTCERCGQTDEQCCANEACNAGRVCVPAGTCQLCGLEGQPCCAGVSPCTDGTTCVGGTCTDI
jgi:hypothetical protein